MKIIFLGNHSVGVESLSAIIQDGINVAGIVAHPLDSEDGLVYKSVYEYAKKNNIPVIRGEAKASSVLNFIKSKEPDLLWVVDYKFILPDSLLKLAKLGAINLHPSVLPKYRGRAPVNWAIINGESELGLTAHYIDEGVDTGDIILQKKITLSSDEDISDALTKLYPVYREMTSKVFRLLSYDKVKRVKQNNLDATSFSARKSEDGLINWNEPADRILNLIRAVAKPYPGAFSYVRNHRIIIWKASMHTVNSDMIPGTITDLNCGRPIVACKDYALNLDKYEIFSGNKIKLNIGEKLQSDE